MGAVTQADDLPVVLALNLIRVGFVETRVVNGDCVLLGAFNAKTVCSVCAYPVLAERAAVQRDVLGSTDKRCPPGPVAGVPVGAANERQRLDIVDDSANGHIHAQASELVHEPGGQRGDECMILIGCRRDPSGVRHVQPALAVAASTTASTP